ncbi:MAG: HutD family protein [Thermoanaerobaculia bacterium]|nr:HutD family protein [Thermoanaerobaculia bacterium]
MMRFELLTAEDYVEVPWKNGRGMTSEIAREPRTGEEFDWRVSMAGITEDGPFSNFAGYNRVIVALDGAGFSLVHAEIDRSVLLGSLEPYEFSGDWATNCQLRGGPVRDFNVITARTRASARVEVAMGTRLHHFDCRGRVILAYCVRGALMAEPTTRVHAFVVAGETLRVDGADHVVVSGEDQESAAILVEIGLG